MALVAATGIWSTQCEMVREILAKSEGFQAFAGVGSESAALDRIHLTAFDGNRPFALLWADDLGLAKKAAGARGYFRPSGSVFVAFERDVTAYAGDSAEDRRNAEIDYMNLVGAAIQGVRELSGSGSLVDLTGMSVLDFNRSSEDEKPTRGDYFWSLWSFVWGQES